MPAGPIKLDRILTFSRLVLSDEPDEHGNPVFERQSHKVWARREDVQRGFTIAGNSFVASGTTPGAVFTVRPQSVRGIETEADQLLTERDGTKWTIKDFGDYVDSYGGSRPQYLAVLCEQVIQFGQFGG